MAALLVREAQGGVRERHADKSVWGDAPESDVASLHGASAELGPGQSASADLAPQLCCLGGSALEVTTPADDLLISCETTQNDTKRDDDEYEMRTWAAYCRKVKLQAQSPT